MTTTIRIIKGQDVERKREEIRRTELAMLKLLMEKYPEASKKLLTRMEAIN